MDLTVLLGTLLETFVNFWLSFLINGLFSFLGDLLFGGGANGLL